MSLDWLQLFIQGGLDSMGFISTIQLQRKSTWCYSVLQKPAEESSKLTKNHPPRQLMNDTSPACSLPQESRLEDETLDTNKIVCVCVCVSKWCTIEKHESDLHCKRHLDKLPRQNSLTTCKTSRTYSAFSLRYKISQRQTLCVSGW